MASHHQHGIPITRPRSFHRRGLHRARWPLSLFTREAALLPVRQRLVSARLSGDIYPASVARWETGAFAYFKGRQDAGSHRRCGNGRFDGGIGAATVRRLRIDRYLRANEGAQHRGRRVERPAQRGADLPLAGRRPRWRGSPGPRRGGRWWSGGNSGGDTAVQRGRERNKEAVRSRYRRGRRRRVSSHAQAGPVDVPVQARVRVRSRQRGAVPDHRAHGLQADTVASDRRRGDGDLFEWSNRHRRGSRRRRRDQLRHVAAGVAEPASQALD